MPGFKPLATLLAMTCAGLVAASLARASELSLVSGVFQHEEFKTDTQDQGSKTAFGVGARYAEPISGGLFWYAQGALTANSFTKGAARDGPGDSTSLDLGGGVRYYFLKLTDKVEPYAAVLGLYRDDKDAAAGGGNGVVETDKNGLYYSAAFGIRLSLQKEFFVDFEVPLFESALFATEKSITYGPTATTTVETKRTELYVKSTGTNAFNSMNVALGFRF